MKPFVTIAVAALVVTAAACGDVDELDLGDLSDRTVPASASTAAPEPSVSPGSPAGGLRRERGEFLDTCSVLSADEVASATGLAVIGAEEEPGFGCVWFVENIDPSIIADDAITFRPFPASQYAAQRDAIEQGLQGEEIVGLGDDAVYVGTETLGSVWVLVGDVSFEVGNQFAFTAVDGRPYQEALAAAIVDAIG